MNKTRVEPVYLNTITYQNRKSVLGLFSSLGGVFGKQQSPSNRELYCTILKSNLCVILGIFLLLFLISIVFYIGKCINYLKDLNSEVTSVEEFITYLDSLKSSGLLIHLTKYQYQVSEQRSSRNEINVLLETNFSYWSQNFVILSGSVTCSEFQNDTVDISKLGVIVLDATTVFSNLTGKVSSLRHSTNSLSLLSSVLGFMNEMIFQHNMSTNPVLLLNASDIEMQTTVEKNTSLYLHKAELQCDNYLNGNFTMLLDNLLDDALLITQDVNGNIHRQYVTIAILLLTWLTLLLLSYYISIRSVVNILKPSPMFQRIYVTVNLKYMQIVHEKEQSELLLHQMLPASVADKLIAGQPVEAETFEEVTIYFSDIVGFNDVALSASPIQIVNLLNSIYGSVLLNIFVLDIVQNTKLIFGESYLQPHIDLECVYEYIRLSNSSIFSMKYFSSSTS